MKFDLVESGKSMGLIKVVIPIFLLRLLRFAHLLLTLLLAFAHLRSSLLALTPIRLPTLDAGIAPLFSRLYISPGLLQPLLFSPLISLAFTFLQPQAPESFHSEISVLYDPSHP